MTEEKKHVRLKSKLIAALGAGVLAAAFFAVPASAAAPPPIDVSNHSVECDSLVGTIKFATALIPGGTSANSITIKATLDGCDDQDDAANDNTDTVSIAPSKLSGILSSNTNDCQGLIGLSTGTSGSTTISWKTNAKQLGTGLPYPKIFDSGHIAGKAASVVTVNQTFGGTYVADGTTSWGGSGYGMFQIGADAAHGNTAAPTVTGAFTGGNAGADTTFDGTTGQSSAALAVACFGKGIKLINFGIGRVGTA
jgi:hypothetical protein